ncbi:hypothetical protein ACFL2J_01910 [Candidatus Omnitrophota bacterium]
MTLKEILDKCGSLEIAQRRSIEDENAEIVVYNKDISEWDKLLTDILGAAIKPAGVEPSEDYTALAKDHGGIYKKQTLYKKDFDSGSVMAMFWPWQDNIRTTLKMIVLKK